MCAPRHLGVIVYRLEESLLYPNCSLLNSTLVDHVKKHTRRGKDMGETRLGDRPWNDPGPKRGHEAEELARDAAKPLLRAIVLDFSTVSVPSLLEHCCFYIEKFPSTGLTSTPQACRRSSTLAMRLSGGADRTIEFHFACVLSPWIKRALVACGFGTGEPSGRIPTEVAAVVALPC